MEKMAFGKIELRLRFVRSAHVALKKKTSVIKVEGNKMSPSSDRQKLTRRKNAIGIMAEEESIGGSKCVRVTRFLRTDVPVSPLLQRGIKPGRKRKQGSSAAQ